MNTAPLQIEGLAARVAALDVLRAALDHRGGFDEALARAPFNALAPRERGYARALTMVALRRLGPIDRALNARLQKPPPAAVLAILRLGAAQLFYMGAPDFAVVNTCVELAAARPDARPFKGLVNAVLRALARAEPPIDDGQGLAPDWIMARWRSAYGEGDAARIAAMIGDEPATDLTLRDPGEAAVLYEALEATPLPGGGLRAGLRGEVIDWPGFAEGRWWVQDAAAAIPARLLRLQPGESALDLCAAPGGKTLQMAAGGGEVVAVDRSALRLRRAAENLHRVNLSAELIAADAGAWPDPRQFDAVLLDAPCTATGTFRRHPDVLWAGRPSDIAKLAQAQARLLDAAARKVKPGGRLVYCVCSLEPEEGEGHVEPFLKRNTDFTVVPIAPGEGGAPIASITAAGTLRLLPFHIDGGADGFFACRFVRLG